MAGFREQSLKNLRRIALNLPLPLLRQFSGQHLISTVYHTVSDSVLPHLSALYSPKGTKAFIEDLDFLLEHFEAIDYHELNRRIKNESPSKKPAFLLTFDDGLREFHDVIAPILLKKGIPAICFLNSAFIDNKDLFFRYKASLILNAVGEDAAKKEKLKALFEKEKIESFILGIDYANRTILDDAANAIEIDFEAYLSQNKPYLSSEHIESRIKDGFHFGSHSIDHPEYRLISLEEQVYQTKESTSVICDKFDLSYKTFAFPFTDYGVTEGYFDQIKKQEIVDLSFGAAGIKKDSAFNNFQRIPMETNAYSAKEILGVEYLYYLLKAPFGKNKIQRK